MKALWWWRITVFSLAVLLSVDAADNETALSEDVEEKIQTFEEYEKQMKDSANNLVRKVLPSLMQNAGASKISGPCMSSLMRIIGGLRQLREWALRFVDACGKLPPGILEGTSLSLGDYDQCLDIKVGKKTNPPENPEDVLFTGQYCLLENHRPEVILRSIREYETNKDAPIAKTKSVLSMFVRYKHLRNTTFKLGVCIPSKCTKEDLTEILSTDTLKAVGKLEVAYCEKHDDPHIRSMGQDAILGVFGFIGGCLFLGTCIDIFMRFKSKPNERKLPTEKPSSFTQLVQSVSLYSNALHVVDTENYGEPLRILCAVRTLTVMLTIYSHTYGHIHELHFQKFSKPANFLKFFESFTFSGIANGSVGMDTVVFLAGITITYTRWRYIIGKEPLNLNIGGLLMKRYFRMTAGQLLIMGLFALLPLIGSGPLWSAYMDKLMDNCKERWWLNILFISNFWSARQTCLYHFWILAVIMQLTLLSVVILLLLKWSQKSGVLFCLFLTLIGIITVGVITVINDLPGSMAFFMLDVRSATIAWRQVYSLAYDHVGPFCIGLLTGYYLAIKKDKLPLKWKFSTLIWCVSISCTSAVLFGLYEYRKGERISTSLGTFYAVTHRNVWTLGIAWLVVACTTGHGGAATRFLRAKIFISLDRLCYMAFMLHIPIMFFHSGSIRERWFMGHFELMFYAIGYITLSFLGSFVLYITCVRPFYYVEEKITSYFSCSKEMKVKQHRTFQPTDSSLNSRIPSTVFDSNDGCINLGYSKKLEGV